MNYASLPPHDPADIANFYGHHAQRPLPFNNNGPVYHGPYGPSPAAYGDQPGQDIPMQDMNSGAQGHNESGHSSAANLTQRSFKLVPIHPPIGAPPLDFRPFCLRASILWLNSFTCLALGGCIFAALYGFGSDRQARLTSENAHILSTYGPTLIATITLVCFRATFSEYFRMLPFYRMADQKGQISQGASAAKSVGGSYFPWIFVSHSDDPWRKVIAQILLFAVSLLTTFKSVFLGSQETEGGWILTVHPRPAYFLVGAYLAMALFYIIIWLLTMNRSTGLKWEPAAPCDHLALVWRTNAMSHVAELPMSHQKAYKVLRADVRWRVGYWRRYDENPAGEQTVSIVHGIGALDNVQGGTCKEEGSCTCHNGGRCSYSRFLYPPMSNSVLLSIFLIILLVCIGGCVYIAATGVFMKGYDLTGSWLRLNATYVPNATKSDADEFTDGYVIVAGQVIRAGDSTTANILFRALPTYFAGLYVPYFDAMEIRLRDITWISALATGPQTSGKSLALDYATQLSFVIPATACEQRHFRLALVAFVNTFAPLCPVFVAGMIIFERKSAEVLHLSISKTSFVVVSVYLVFFVIATIVAWPRKTELLLRPFYSIADLVKPFADSWLLEEDTDLDAAMCERTRERFRAKILLAEYRYQLGVTRGTCGKSHRGIDIIGNEEGARYRDILSAQQLIREMKGHTHGSSTGYSSISEAIGDANYVMMRANRG